MSETIVETLRAAIMAADATLTEHVKWNAPSFVHNGVRPAITDLVRRWIAVD